MKWNRKITGFLEYPSKSLYVQQWPNAKQYRSGNRALEQTHIPMSHIFKEKARINIPSFNHKIMLIDVMLINNQVGY